MRAPWQFISAYATAKTLSQGEFLKMLEEDLENTDEIDPDSKLEPTVVWILDDAKQTVKQEKLRPDKYERAIRKMAKTYLPLSKEAEIETVLQAKANNTAAKLRLFLHVTGPILMLMDKLGGARAKADFADVYHGCLEALEKAFQKFDPARGVLFRTYARSWLIQVITDYKHENHFQYPQRIRRGKIKILIAVDVLAQELGREPTISELAERTGLSNNVATRLLRLIDLEQVQSLDEDPQEAIEIASPEFFDSAHEEKYQARFDALREAISQLGDRQKFIVHKHLGLAGETASNFLDIGKIIGVSERRARTLFGTAKRNIVRSISKILEEPAIASEYFDRLEKKALVIRISRGRRTSSEGKYSKK